MDPLEQVRVFLDCFKANVNPTDPLPVRVPVYNLKYDEIKPAIVDWTRTYLDQFGCPPCILTPIIRKVSEAVLSHCKENPQSCGYTGRDYKTLQLNHEVISRVNQTCSELLDNENLNKLLAELPGECQAVDQTDSMVATRRKTHFSRGVKHKRRTMEDRHVCLPDFNTLFDTKDTEPTAFYGVYDGHGGQEAASFAASHLHYNVAQSVHYPHQMELAFWEGFLKTDKQFLEKCDNHHLRSGSTVVVCFHRLVSKKIHIAWVGDSQAILVAGSPSGCTYDTLVHPTHAASNPQEFERIRRAGGTVLVWDGQHRVNGQLAITRAIGNPNHKDVVTAQPDTTWRRCKEEDAFLVLASDGLWENCLSHSISMFILYAIRKFSDNPQKITDYLIEFAKPHTTDNITVIIVFLKDLQTIIKDTPFIEEIESKARILNSRNMDINGADNNDIMSKNSSIPLEDQKAFVDIQNFMAIDSALLKPKSASPLCVGPVDDMGFLSDGGLGPETDVDGLHDTKQQTHPMFSEEEDESPVLDNGDAGHGFVSNLEQNTIGDYNPFGLTSDVMVEALGNVPEDISNEIEEEEEPSSVSAEPVDLSEEHAAPETPHLNGSGEHHFDEPTEAGQLIDAVEEEDAVPAMKAELNENEQAPLKSGDEPIVNDLLGGDSIVDNKLIDQLDSFGISDAIRRQLIEQQVTGATINHEQEEDEDDGQLMEEKHSELDGGDDGEEKGDVHHEKAFDTDNVNVSDHHSADVKQDDDAGCCEDSEEDEWDYVKVNQQQQQQQQQEQQQEQHNHQEQPQTQEKPQESTPPEETESQFGNSDSFATEDQEEEKEELVEKHSEEQTHELEQHRDQEAEQEEEQQQQQEEQAEVLYQEQEREAEVQLDATAEPNTSEAPVDILGDNTESTVSESTKEVDDVIIVGGGEAKEVVNLLNDFNEDVPQPAAIETLCDTSNINEEDSSAVHLVPSDSTNMEASMYGGSVAEQPVSPDTPVSPVEAFERQQQQQQQQQQQLFSDEKDMFGSSLDETMSPTGAEELHEKHLDEAEEKTMHQGAGDLGWQLNPEAKEFVPVLSPTDEPTNVFAPARMLEHESFKLRDDAIVAQSPRKGTAPSMEDLDLPAEREFQTEMDKRPHEFEAALEEGGEQQSPLSPNPFDQLDDRVMPGNGLDLMNGGELLQPEEAELLSPGKIDPVQLGTSDTASAEESELLNKVQELPVTEDEEQQELLIAQQHYEPVRAVSLQGQEELGVDVMEPQTYSAKEELYVEQKETVDEPVLDAASPVSPEIVQDFSQLSMNGHTEKENATNPFAQDNTYFETSVPSDTPQAENDLFGTSDTHMDTTQATTEETESMETEEEPKPRFYQESLLEASVYDPEPSLLSAQEPSAPAEPEPSSEIAPEPAATAASAVSEVAVEPPTEPLAVEVAPPVEEQPMEAEKLAEENKTAVEAAASGVAAATAVVAAAAVAATAVAASKTAKPKVPAATGAKKAGPTTTGTKSSSAASKDGAAKSTTATASRVGSGAGAPAAASRKPTVPAVKKAPTTTAKPPAAASTNGVKEARPASSTAAARPSLAVKKPATDAAKTATTKTTAAPSVAAARPTKAATVPSSTTKPASASSTTRTAAPKAATTGTTTAAKATSRLSTTGTTARTVTSRPSSAISTSSVPSKPASATTTTTVKRTVAAKTTNGTTTTDGVTKTTKTSTSTTTSSTASRTGVTRPAGTGTAAKPSSTLTAKKPLDAKPAAAAGTKTATAKPSTTTRTSLAPKPTATSPAVRKVQQNGVAKKPTAASPNPIKKVTVPPKKLEEQLPASNEIIPTTTNNIETNGNANDSEAVIVAPPESADPLLVPVPQAM